MNLLVVDDDPFIRKTLTQHLRARFDCRVACAHSSLSALDALHRDLPDLVLLDVHLGEEDDGFTLLRRIRRLWSQSELPVMMVTSLTDSRHVVRGFDLGANDYVTKPLDFPVVMARIANLMRSRASTTAAPVAPLKANPFPAPVAPAPVMAEIDVSVGPLVGDGTAVDPDPGSEELNLPCEIPVMVVIGTRNFFCKTCTIGQTTLELLTFEEIPRETAYRVEMIDPRGNALDLSVLETKRTPVQVQAEGVFRVTLAILDATEWYDAFFNQLKDAFERDGERGFAEILRGTRVNPNDSSTVSMPASLLFHSASVAKRVAGGVRYRFERLLGRGGFAAVFLVRDLVLKRSIAMKVLDAEYAAQAELREHFLHEAQIAAQFHHPNIVFVFEVGEYVGDEMDACLDFPQSVLADYPDRFIYFTMQYIEGKTLGDEIRDQGRLSQTQGLAILTDVAKALSFAHEKGVIHRDIKPENIMIDPDSKIIVTDFGTATLTPRTSAGGSDEGIDTQDANGQVAFTPAYASPEQFLGQDIDFRSDLYSFGAMAYKVFTGTPPFSAESLSELISRHLKEVPPPLENHSVSLSPTLESIIMTCLAKNPQDRFESTQALFQHLISLRDQVDPKNDTSFDARLAEILDQAIVAETPKQSASILEKLQALIRVHAHSSQPERLEKIRSALSNPDFLNVLVEQNLNPENRNAFLHFIGELKSSSVAFVLLQRFQMESTPWKKDYLAKLAAQSLRDDLLPLVLFASELPDPDAAAIVRGFATAIDHLNGEVLTRFAKHQGRLTQLELVKLCFQSRHRVQDAPEILSLWSSGVGTVHEDVQHQAGVYLENAE